jgi:hypothetical protein
MLGSPISAEAKPDEERSRPRRRGAGHSDRNKLRLVYGRARRRLVSEVSLLPRRKRNSEREEKIANSEASDLISIDPL